MEARCTRTCSRRQRRRGSSPASCWATPTGRSTSCWGSTHGARAGSRSCRSDARRRRRPPRRLRARFTSRPSRSRAPRSTTPRSALHRPPPRSGTATRRPRGARPQRRPEAPAPHGALRVLRPLGEAALPRDSLDAVIRRRGSTRAFDRERSLRFEDLSTALDRATRGVPSDFLGPPPASLLELYLIVHAVEGLAPGAYVHHRAERALELLREGPFRQAAGHLALGQALAADAAVNVYSLVDLARVLERFGNRGYRAAQLEGGNHGRTPLPRRLRARLRCHRPHVLRRRGDRLLLAARCGQERDVPDGARSSRPRGARASPGPSLTSRGEPARSEAHAPRIHPSSAMHAARSSASS